MAAMTRADAISYLRERWMEQDDLQIAIALNSPILGVFEKSHLALVGGRYMSLPTLGVADQGRSASYAKANTNQKAAKPVRFDVTYVSDYQVVKQDGDVMDDMSGEPNSIVSSIDFQTDNAIAMLRKDLSLGVFGNAGGARGRIGSIATGLAGANCRIVLLNTTDSKHFETGMVLAASANDGTASGHALRDSGDTITMTGIDRMKGYLEFAADVTSISGLTANDYLFVDGDFKSKMSGFGGWIPVADPAVADSFYGVDRTANVNVLSGLRFDGTGRPIEQAIVSGASYGDLYDCHFDVVVVNPVRWGNFCNSLGADRANRLTTITGTAGKATISYEAISVATNFGTVPVVSDGGCGATEGFGLTKSTWVLGHVGNEGELVRIIADDGNEIRRDSSGGDSWQIDFKFRGNLGCKQPGRNMRFAFSSLT